MEDYNRITQDWEHGQVLPKFQYSISNLVGLEPSSIGDHRDWNGWDVDKNGYLTRKVYQKQLDGVGNLEYISGGGELKALRSITNGRALLKEGEYFLYLGMKNGKPYIGSTSELLGRYTQTEIDSWGMRMFQFFKNNPSVRMPNRGIAIGFEQMVIRLNNCR